MSGYHGKPLEWFIFQFTRDSRNQCNPRIVPGNIHSRPPYRLLQARLRDPGPVPQEQRGLRVGLLWLSLPCVVVACTIVHCMGRNIHTIDPQQKDRLNNLRKTPIEHYLQNSTLREGGILVRAPHFRTPQKAWLRAIASKGPTVRRLRGGSFRETPVGHGGHGSVTECRGVQLDTACVSAHFGSTPPPHPPRFPELVSGGSSVNVCVSCVFSR